MAEPNDVDWTQIDWNDLYPRLLLVAAGMLNRRAWRGKYFGPAPGAPTPHDFVHQAIEETMSGERVWNRDVSLFQHMVGVIRSKISHLSTSQENKVTQREDDKIVQIADYRINPEAAAIRKAQEEAFLAFLEAKKPALRQLAYWMLHEPIRDTPELTVRLNMSVRDVDSLKRALRLATEEYVKAERARDEEREIGGGHEQ